MKSNSSLMELAFIVSILLLQVLKVPGQDCTFHAEPPNVKQWRRLYNIQHFTSNEQPLFQGKGIYKSPQIRTNVEPGLMEELAGFNVTHSVGSALVLYQTENIYGMRKLTFTMMYSFYAGDTAVIHVFDPTKKTYTRNQLGYHTNKYFLAVPKGNYLSIDIEKHTEEKYIVIGNTFVLGNSNESVIEFASKETMLKEFPNHKEVIENLYSRMDIPKLSR